MWTRAELKSRAWSVLRGSYWKAFLVSLILAFAGGSAGGGFGGSSGNFGGRNRSGTEYSSIDWVIVGTVIAVVVVVLLFVFALRIFLGYALEVGCRKYYIKAAENDVSFDNVGFSFKKERYWDVLVTMLLKSVFNALWCLALIIPGIIKFYSYRMTPYILADNPNIGRKRAIKLSMDMTNGQKLDMFVLDLSFIGWYLLGFLACCIGMFFVAPYKYSTEAELYLVLRKNALDNGLCTYQELLLEPKVDGFDDYQKPLI